jgi:hypothetical protein
MLNEALLKLYRILRLIKQKSDLCPCPSELQIKARNQALARLREEQKLVVASEQKEIEFLCVSPDSKRIRLIQYEINQELSGLGRYDVENILGLLRSQGFIVDFKHYTNENNDRLDFFECIVDNFFDDKFTAFEEENSNIFAGNEVCANGKFHFVDGILFRDHCDYIIKSDEKTQEYAILRHAFSIKVDERIDGASGDIELDFRQIYDVSRRLNEKIKNTFKLNRDFFISNSSEKYIKRVVE